MSSKGSPVFDKHFVYTMDLDLDQSVDKSDALRSKLFQLIANKDLFETEEEFNDIRLRLENQLAEEVDRSDGKNTFLKPTILSTDLSAKRSSVNEFQSSLYGLSAEELCKKLKIKRKVQTNDNSNECEIIDVFIKPKKRNIVPVLTNSEVNDIIEITDSGSQKDVEVDNGCHKRAEVVTSTEKEVNVVNDSEKADILSRIGSYKSGFDRVMKRSNSDSGEPTPHSTAIRKPVGGLSQSSSYRRLESSPTRVSGIFKSNSPKTSKSSEKSGETAPKIVFMTGLEKKVVEDVKKGSIDVKSARKMLNTFQNSIKSKQNSNNNGNEEEVMDPNLKNIDKTMIETIENEIITSLEPIEWSDVAGLGFAKNKIQEIAVLPLLRPDLFKGLRKPPKGILLFGPPGTGKTFLGRCIASQTKSTFFSITVSALNSKWIGEGEKMIRAMFAVARSRQPSVIFIDEIDSLLKNRSDTEHESSRRMKTEFLAQFEGVATDSNDRILIIGATNRPQELDDAARRRLAIRLYIRLPDQTARQEMIRNSLEKANHSITDAQLEVLAERTDGYSGADMRDLSREAAMEPIRESTNCMSIDKIQALNEEDIRRISFEDFSKAIVSIKPSVCKEDIKQYEEWNQLFGNK